MKFVNETIQREGLLVGDIEDIEVDTVRSGDSVRLSYVDCENDTTAYQLHVIRQDDEFPDMGRGDLYAIHRNLLVYLECVE